MTVLPGGFPLLDILCRLLGPILVEFLGMLGPLERATMIQTFASGSGLLAGLVCGFFLERRFRRRHWLDPAGLAALVVGLLVGLLIGDLLLLAYALALPPGSSIQAGVSFIDAAHQELLARF